MDHNLGTNPDIFFSKIKDELLKGLPGSVSHEKMLPPGRILMLPSEQVNYHESAVLILLFPIGQEIQLCLIRRPATMKNHAGQIAFPGGKREKEDINLVHTALREAQEEIGLDQNQVEVLGVLSSVYVQVSDFLITPVLGWMNSKPEIQMDKREVDEVILVSLNEISDAMNLVERDIQTTTGLIKVPGYNIRGNFIWGATAMMLSELADIFLADS
jgi:8-oxo-dGTP pyrophosphatase MutT (NUDIX family)